MRTAILCGGKGTRAYPKTVEMPKPLLDVAGEPILRHVMGIFAAQGHTDFVLAAGFMAEMIDDFATTLPAEWDVEVVDTGLETNTGERLAKCRDRLGERFFATYGDGLADIDLAALLAFHGEHGGAATVTTVPLRSQFGTLELGTGGRVEKFKEKPILEDHWINGGFFVFDERAFDQWKGDDLERDVLPELAGQGELFAYRHRGFWKSMDTYKDALELTALCRDGEGPRGRIPPWTRPEPSAS
jgi:glucose-1-phosphate cytidylyltransferase